MANDHFYYIDSECKNVAILPNLKNDIPNGSYGWLVWRYRQLGWNINNLRQDILDRFTEHFARYGFDYMESLYVAFLDAQRATVDYQAANCNEPSLVRDASRMWRSLDDAETRHDWLAKWRPPRIGPLKPNPMASFTSKHPRIHTKLGDANMTALFQTGRPSAFV